MNPLRKTLPRGSGNMTFILLALNIIIYFFTSLFDDLTLYLSLNVLTFFSYRFYWTLITHMFAHAGMNHILFNMVALLFVGHLLEERIGSWEFLLYYLLCGALAGLFSVILYLFLGVNSYLLGASGALYAVLLAYAVYFPEARLYFFGMIPIKSPQLILLYAALNIIPLLFSRNSGVAHLTHLSGFFFGMIYLRIRMNVHPIRNLIGGKDPFYK